MSAFECEDEAGACGRCAGGRTCRRKRDVGGAYVCAGVGDLRMWSAARRGVGGAESAAGLEKIHCEDVTHSTVGVAGRDVKGAFNATNPEKAGLIPEFLENLEGKTKGEVYGGSKMPQASVAVGYDGEGGIR